MRLFFLALFLLPFIELWGLIAVGSQVGVLPVVLWVFGMIIVGVQLLRLTGALGAMNIAQSLRSGQLPGPAISKTLIRGIGAVLFIIPGFVSDVVGLICFIPGVHRLLLVMFSKAFTVTTSHQFHQSFYRDSPQGNVFDHEGPASSSNDNLLPSEHSVRSKNNQN